MQQKPFAEENKRGSYSNVWFTHIGSSRQKFRTKFKRKHHSKRDSDE
jgi:hypothetical protein